MFGGLKFLADPADTNLIRGGPVADSEDQKKDVAAEEPSLEIAAPVLELPPAAENPSATLAGMFAEDHLAVLAAKFSVLESFLKLLTRDQKFSDFVREVLLTVMRVVKSEAGAIFELDHQNKVLFFRAAAGQSSDSVSKFVVPVGQGIVGYVAESRQPLLVGNVAENKIHLKSIGKAVGFEARNLVAVPLMIRGRVYGVLELLNRVGEENYTNADMELLSYLCEAASKAIEIRLMLGWRAGSSSTGGNSGDSRGEAA